MAAAGVALALGLTASACELPPPGSLAGDERLAIEAYEDVFAPNQGAVAGGARAGTAPTALSPRGCDAGSVDRTFERRSIDQVNYFRNMAGLDSVRFNASMSADAQEVALVRLRASMDGSQGSPHHPAANGWACAPAGGDADTAAARSNISSAYTTAQTSRGTDGPRGVTGQQRDAGDNNATVGHRQSIMFPPSTRMGSGSTLFRDGDRTRSSHALYALDPAWFTGADTFDPDRIPERTGPDFVAWPPLGYVPDEVVFPRWSYSPNEWSSDVDLSKVRVEMFHGSTPIPIERVTVRDAAGISIPDDVIVWEPDLSAIRRVSWDTVDYSSGPQRQNVNVRGENVTVSVRISGIRINGRSQDASYLVAMMDAARF